MSNNGESYTAANNTKLENHGQRKIEGLTKGRVKVNMNLQVADVNKVLTSVSQTCDKNNVVIYCKDKGYIVSEKDLDGMR